MDANSEVSPQEYVEFLDSLFDSQKLAKKRIITESFFKLFWKNKNYDVLFSEAIERDHINVSDRNGNRKMGLTKEGLRYRIRSLEAQTESIL